MARKTIGEKLEESLAESLNLGNPKASREIEGAVAVLEFFIDFLNKTEPNVREISILEEARDIIEGYDLDERVK